MFVFLFVLLIALANAAEPVLIGTSQSRFATGLNNARKIARTQDDTLVVVYQDSIDNQQAVMLTFSADGLNWATPQRLDYGSSPAIAVSNSNSFYVTYTKSNESVIKLMVFDANDLPELNDAYDIDIYYGSPGAQHASPVVDVGPRFVHLAFQSTNVGAQHSAIRYGLFHRNLEPATSIFTVSAANTSASQPTLQTDLEYSSDYVNLFWNEEQELASGIHHLSLDADSLYALQPATENDFWQALENGLAHINLTFAQLIGCANPSISLRTTVDGSGITGYDNSMILGCDNLVRQQLNLFSIDFDTKAPDIDIRSGFRQDSDNLTWPSVDDIILNPRSCAIVWHNTGSIFYGQSLWADIMTDPPIEVNSTTAAYYPNVCYKTFRSDVFDVVWTEGAGAPYSVYYRRMEKEYWFDPVEILVNSTLHGTYLHSFKRTIRVRGGINGILDLELVDSELPDSLAFEKHELQDNVWQLVGTPQRSGSFAVKLRARDIGDDVGLTEEKTVVLDIQNSAPEIAVIPETITWQENGDVLYTIEIHDAEENDYDWTVESLPAGLTLDKPNFTISGFANLPDTSTFYETVFHIIADDGDKIDTLNVNYKVEDATAMADGSLSTIPQKLTLYKAYPNPFNPVTNIKLEVPAQQHIVVAVFDVRGSRIKTLHDGELAAGFHTLAFDGSDVPSGAYFIRMQSDDQIQMQKCMLLK